MATSSTALDGVLPHVHLVPSSIPRMPFSSPMTEEILSPTSPNAPNNTAQPQNLDTRRGPGQENVPSSTRRFSIQKPTKGEWGHNKEGGQSKNRWPGLNVVTNFSKPPGLAKCAVDAVVKHRPPNTDENIKGAKAVMATNHNREGHVVRGNQGLGLQQNGNSIAASPHIPNETKGTVNNLKRASSKWSNISPSDRAIMIGISIPSSKLAEHMLSPEGDSVQPQGLTARQYTTDDDPPITPTIIVTPAKDEAPWSASPNEPAMANRRRPASSVYSQAIQRNRGISQLPDIPPVPAYPAFYQAQRGKSSPHGGRKNSLQRVVSSCTVFDEDDSPQTGFRDRRHSGESQLRILTRSSQDSLATRHRSQGWWNYIVSPFLSRRNTMMLRSSSGSPPDLPSPHPGANMARNHLVHAASPPETTEMEGSKSGHTSFWTDASPFEADEKSGLTLNRGLDEHPRAAVGPDSYSPPKQFEGFGEAAEYYQACWHDQNSPTPYFECQNHSCLPNYVRGLEDPPIASRDRGDATAESKTTFLIDEAETQSLSKPKTFQQEPANRFSAAFKEAFATKAKPARPISEATEIEDLNTTPEVQEAHAAPVVQGGAIVPAAQAPESKVKSETTKEIVESLQPMTSHAEAPPSAPKVNKPVKRIVAIMPPQQPPPALEQPLSPEDASPAVHSAAPGANAIALAEVPRDISPPPPAQTTYIVNHYHGDPAIWRNREQTSLADFEPQPRFDPPPRVVVEDKTRNIYEKNDRPPQYTKAKKTSKFRMCFKFNKRTKKQKWIRAGIAAALAALILLIVFLVMFLKRKGDKMPVQSQWLNITGYPPMPTGISTIVQPDAILENPGCVQPSTMWDCSLPKEQQPLIVPNAPNQPNFRVEIRFRNGTSQNGTALNATGFNKRSKTGSPNPVSAGSFIRNRLLRARDSFSNGLFVPSPSPPNQEDQVFLGNSTDNNTTPFDGESTPFFMTFEDPTKLSSQLSKRQLPDPQNLTDPFPDLTKSIPPPDINPDGTAAAANLLPLPSAQPLRLYNRGLPTEHYGFYTYFDRSIFLKSTALVNASSSIGEVPDDKDGGAQENAATVRCTWAQTRFLVQIWTNKGSAAPLLPNPNSTDSATPTPTNNNNASQNLNTSSANDFRRPGSFPYPISITLDRHGGDITKKQIYCYGLDQREHIILDQKKVQLEDRAFGGVLVNSALGPFGHASVSRAEGGPGGVDGGVGGCGCVWRNFGG